jgi:NodT family efflux transporter outer membrane factor (OMF) lipoprotein
MIRRVIVTTALAAVLVGGCTPSPHPDFAVPTPPAPASAVIAPASGPAQQIEAGTLVPAEWWKTFGSAKLDALVAEALTRDNDLSTAEAALRQAREQASAVAGSQGPQVDAGYLPSHQRVSQSLANPLPNPSIYEYSLSTAQLTVAYPLDLFGAGRNKVRSARAAAEAAGHRLAAAHTMVVANLVLAVIQHASLAAQVEATRSAIVSDRELVALLRRRQQLGDVGASDVSAQETQLATTEAQLPTLERQEHHQEGAIALLLGRAAGSPLPDLPSFDELHLPADVPRSVPADVIAHRPDIRAAEAQVRGAAADFGAAVAARLPAVQLTGSAGGAATEFAQMFATPNLFFTLVGAVTTPVFRSGALLHQQRAARAAFEGAEAQYRTAALQAFLDVDDAISGLRTDADALDAASRADASAQRTLGFTRRQVELGAQGTFALLNASAVASLTTSQLVQTRAARLSDTVALFQACGTES